jgi:flagellar biosynthesis protein FlhG
MDQAERLRDLMKQDSWTNGEGIVAGNGDWGSSGERRPRVFSVTSGKGGVGKTNVVANLAYAFTRLGKRVLVLDADLGLSNIDVLLGLTPRFTIEHLFNRERALSEIVVAGPGGMSVLPASSGVLDLVDLDQGQKILLLNELDHMILSVDILLIDTGAGISSNVMYFNMAAQESIVIVTPEPTSITDAYALIKILSTKFRKRHFTVLVNMAPSETEAREVFKKISMVADRYLGSLSIDYLGFIPSDSKLPMAVRLQKPVLEIYPKAPSSRSFIEVAKNLTSRPIRKENGGNVQFLWKQLFQPQKDPMRGGKAD